MKNKKLSLAVLIAAVIAAACLILGFLMPGGQTQPQPTAQPTAEVTPAPTDAPEETPAATPEATPLPSEEPPLDLDSLPGFLNGGTDVCGIPLPLAIPNTSLVIEGIGQYSGPFVEDGSGEPMANVMALVVKNDSRKFTEFAEITLAVDGKDPAVFQISGLPGKEYVLVMEKNRRPFDRSELLGYETHLFAERDDVSLQADKLKIYAADGALTAQNLTGETLDAVYIRYKSKLVPRCYLGGITYSCKLEALAAGTEKTAQTGHYSDAYSQIVMVETVKN